MTDPYPMSTLTPQHGAVLLRLIWRGVNGRERYTVGSRTLDGNINLELGGYQEAWLFDGWKELPEGCK